MLEIRNNNLKSRAINRVEPTQTQPNQPERKGAEPIIILDQVEFGPRFEAQLKYEWRAFIGSTQLKSDLLLYANLHTCMHIYIYIYIYMCTLIYVTANVLLLST